MKTKTPYQHAIDVDNAFLEPFSSACERIEIVGSLRRKQLEVGDIEIVCIPKIIKGGKKENKRQVQVDPETITVDLFIVTRATWGLQLMIRTGYKDFSTWMVTKRQQGGALPLHLIVKDGLIWSGGKSLETPEEQDVFRVCSLDWIPPEERTGGRWTK